LPFPRGRTTSGTKNYLLHGSFCQREGIDLKNRIRNSHLYVIAGPNGAGKTTFSRKFLPEYKECLEFVNADLIAGGLSPFAPDRAAIQAGRIMLEQIRSLGNRGVDFGFETTLSGKTHLKLFDDLKKKGYHIHLFFLWVNSIDIALRRIEKRVQNGGHSVPEAVVRRRFEKSLFNFFNLYQPVAESWAIFDNSREVPKMIAYEELGFLEIIDPELFDRLSRHKVKR
jgi:predicted ABC-type ATPase